MISIFSKRSSWRGGVLAPGHQLPVANDRYEVGYLA